MKQHVICMLLDLEYVNKLKYKRVKKYSEVNIPENAFSVFGSHATQNDDGDLFSLSFSPL